MELCLRSCGSIVFLRRNFMRLRDYGTRRPTNFAGGLMRRSVVLLAALLLVSVLMAGAVSAADVTINNFADLKQHLEAGDTVTLGGDIGSKESPIEYNQTVNRIFIVGKSSILNLNGHTIYAKQNQSDIVPPLINIGNASTTSPANDGGSLTVNAGTSGAIQITNSSGAYNTVFGVWKKGKLSINGGTFTATKGYAICTNADRDGNSPKYGSPAISVKNAKLQSNYDTTMLLNAEGTTATFETVEITGYLGGIAVAAGDITLKDTKVTISNGGVDRRDPPKDGSMDDGSALTLIKKSMAYKGVINLKLLGNTEITSTYGALHNYITESNDNSEGKTTVTIGDAVKFSGDVVSTQYTGKSAVIGGTFQDTSGNRLLYPGLNQSGVVWTGDAATGYTLAISADGSYKLMEDVTLTATTKIENKVTLDLNGHSIIGPDTYQSAVFEIEGENAELILQSSVQNGNTITGHRGAIVRQGTLTVKSGVTIDATYAGIYVYGSETDNVGPNYSVATIESGAILKGQYGAVMSHTNNHAYGAVLDVSGSLIGKTTSQPESSDGANGLFVHGNLKDTTGTIPQVIIREGAILTGDVIGDQTGQAIAGNGYANITISGGTFTGAEALGIKSGEWLISGGTFTAHGDFVDLPIPNNNGAEKTGAAVAVTTTYDGPISLTIRGGEFLSQNGDALSIFKIPNKDANVKNLVIEGGVFSTQDSSRLGMEFYNDTSNNEPFTEDATISIIGGKYTPGMNSTKIVAPYQVIQDGAYKTVARIESSPKAEVKSEASGAQNVTVSDPGTPGALQLETTGAPSAESVTLNVSGNTDVKLILHAKEGETLTIDETNKSVIGNVTKVTYIPNETVLQNTDNVSFKMHFNVQDLAEVLNGGIKIQVTNSPASGDYTGTYARAFSVTILLANGAELHNTDVELGYTQKSGYTYKVIHAKGSSQNNVGFTYAGGKFKFIAPSFSSYVITETPTPASTSGGGSSAYSFRVLFDTQGGNYLTPATGLSYGDKISKPATPEKSGYTFAGWYKDAACTQGWDFNEGIPGDMTLYAKWTSGSTTEPTATATAQPTGEPTSAPVTTAPTAVTTTAAPVSTTEPGSQPTLTQAPAPVLGALLGLLAAGVLLRRRE